MKSEIEYRQDAAFIAEITAKRAEVSALIESWLTLGEKHSIIKALKFYRDDLDRLASGRAGTVADIEVCLRGITLAKISEMRLHAAEPSLKNYLPNRVPSDPGQELIRILFFAEEQFFASMHSLERELGVGYFAPIRERQAA